MINSFKELNEVLDFISYFRASFPQITKFHFYIYKPHPGAAAQLVATGKEAPNLFAERKWQFEKKVIEAVRNNSTHESHITNMLRHDPKESTSLFCVEANNVDTWLLKTLDKIEKDEALEGSAVSALRVALSNILLNALQATPPGGEVTIRQSTEGGDLVICVQDGGPGIPDDLRQRVWEPFFTTKQRGTGLGLAIVRKRMQEAGGTARLLSRVNGSGARFELRVPLKKP